MGWRTSYFVAGASGLALASIIALLVRDPKSFMEKIKARKGGYEDIEIPRAEPEKKEGEGKKKSKNPFYMFTHMGETAMHSMRTPVSKWVTLAGVARKIPDMAISCFLPMYILHAYPAFKTQYATFNAAMLAICGFTSNILGGMLGDRLETKFPKARVWICIVSALASIPLISLACMGGHHFWLTMVAMTLYVLFTGAFYPNSVSILQNSSEPGEETSKMFSAYQFFCHSAQTVSPIIFGAILAFFGGSHSDPSMFGKLISGFAAVGYGIHAICFWIAGKKYDEVLK